MTIICSNFRVFASNEHERIVERLKEALVQVDVAAISLRTRHGEGEHHAKADEKREDRS